MPGTHKGYTTPTDVPLSVILAETDPKKEIIRLGTNYKRRYQTSMYSFMLLFI